MSLSLLIASLALAAPAHPVSTDLFDLTGLSGFDVDPNRPRAVLTLSRWHRASDRSIRDLWLLDLKSSALRRLTEPSADDRDARWLPNGDLLWVTEVDGKAQLVRMNPESGASLTVTRLADSVRLVDVDARGEAAFVVTDRTAPLDDDFAALRKTHPMSYGHGLRTRSTVWRVDLATERVTPVWEADAHIYALDATLDGERVAVLTEPNDQLITREGDSDLAIVHVDDGSVERVATPPWRQNAPSPYGWLADLAWSPEGDAVAFHVDYDGHPAQTWVVTAQGGAWRGFAVPRSGDAHALEGGLLWAPKGRTLCEREAFHARERVACTDDVRPPSFGARRVLTPGDVVVRGWAWAADGKSLWADVNTPTALPEFGRFTPGKAFTPLTDLNAHARGWTWPTLTLTSWTAPDGTRVEGTLEVPAGWTKAHGPLPLVVDIHGGPTAHMAFARRLSAQSNGLLAAQGYAVLRPNYRGSIGYGDGFLTDLVDRECDVEVADLRAGIDAMISDGVADANRVAAMGWSNGGYLTACMLTAEPRLKAGIVGAGVVDQVLQWALEDTPGHVINFMDGDQPWSAGDAYALASPLRRADRITAPTLIHVGEEDPRVPPAHAEALFRALDTYRKVPTELVVYPEAGHGLRRMGQIEAKVAWDLAWLGRWLAPPPVAPSPTAGNNQP
jgi:dipeptidyl aminopeptidase/acylaminoacyl peptidase